MTLTGKVDRRLVAGGALVAVYLLVAVLTLPGPLGLRPLFDGTGGTLAPYRWVNPPRELAAGNQKPASATKKVPIGANGASAVDVSTQDGQATVSLPDGALAAHPPDDSATVALDPVDPGTLSPAPDPLVFDGNAYRVTITYSPSNGAATVARAGSVLLRYPSTADKMLFSADGASWKQLQAVPSPGNSTVLAPFNAPGWYVAALSKAAPPAASKKKGVNPLVVGAEVLGALVVVGIVVALFRRPGVGRAKSVPAKRPPARRPAAKKRPPPKKRRR